MGIQAECDGEDCNEDILEETGFEVVEGTVEAGIDSALVQPEESYGIFCSMDCLLNTLGGENQ